VQTQFSPNASFFIMNPEPIAVPVATAVTEIAAAENSGASYPSVLASKMCFGGFDYTIRTRKRNVKSNVWTGYYACSHRRKDCPGKLIVRVTDATAEEPEATTFEQSDEHTCVIPAAGNIADEHEAMLNAAADMAMDRISASALDIAREILRGAKEKSKGTLSSGCLAASHLSFSHSACSSVWFINRPSHRHGHRGAAGEPGVQHPREAPGVVVQASDQPSQ
jgi:hypothetical protein